MIFYKQYKINKIIITGNELTKDRIVLRELSFKKDDLIQLGQINKQIQLSKSNQFMLTYSERPLAKGLAE